MENNITLYSTNNESKANMCERLNRTIKTIMWKKFTINGNQKWVKILPEVLKEYNNKIPSVIKTTPKEASENPKTLENIIRENNFSNEHKNHFTQLLTNKKKKPKFKKGNRVRIFRYKSHFEKGYTIKWTNQIFIINKIINSSPITYEIKDLNGEIIEGRFYENELQKTEFY